MYDNSSNSSVIQELGAMRLLTDLLSPALFPTERHPAVQLLKLLSEACEGCTMRTSGHAETLRASSAAQGKLRRLEVILGYIICLTPFLNSFLR